MTKFKTKTLALILMIAFCFGLGTLFSACGSKDDGKIHVVCTVFPQYDWTKNLVQGTDDIAVDLIVKNGADLHSYFSGTPVVDDAIKIKTCDVLIYCGGESEKIVETLISGKDTNQNMKVINLLNILKDENRAVLEDGEENEFDEHVWLSVLNAKLFAEKICETLKQVSPKNADLFEQNFENYSQKLDNLNTSYNALKTEAKQKAEAKNVNPSIVVADRFPFAYLVRDMGFDHCAAFSGCSTETNADFATINTLANFVDEQGLDVILILKGSTNLSLANTIKNQTTAKNQVVLEIDSMQGTSWKDIQNGQTFLGVMQANLTVLTQAMGYLN